MTVLGIRVNQVYIANGTQLTPLHIAAKVDLRLGAVTQSFFSTLCNEIGLQAEKEDLSFFKRRFTIEIEGSREDFFIEPVTYNDHIAHIVMRTMDRNYFILKILMLSLVIFGFIQRRQT